MTTHTTSEANNRLSALLRAARPSPTLPPDFAHAVWLRIEQAETANGTAGSWLDRLAELLMRPRVALTGIAALVVVSAMAGVASGTSVAREAALQRYIEAVAPPMEH